MQGETELQKMQKRDLDYIDMKISRANINNKKNVKWLKNL